jgi:LPPG:FO 2-phospho-L-lactate transferase
MKIVALAGGVGGAKLVDGLAQSLPHADLSVIVNTGDDLELFGLHISPDIDTVCYTLAGISSRVHGWGVQKESWHVLHHLCTLEAPHWFALGDRDLATHLERTRLLNSGMNLSEVTAILCKKFRIDVAVYPMTDDSVRTIVHTREKGDLPFQEYFVKYRFEPAVKGFEFEGSKKAKANREALRKLEECNLVVICPSNPWVSIAPILSIKEISDALISKTVLCVSPIVHGKAIKGPAAKMFREMGTEPSARAVAEYYGKRITAIVIDEQDWKQKGAIEQCGIITYVNNIIMTDRKQRKRVAQEILKVGTRLLKRL